MRISLRETSDFMTLQAADLPKRPKDLQDINESKEVSKNFTNDS